ncbi:MAG: RNA polymerase sigma factor [Clostridia bacterium]|nr:RNA polymerase sigma factor [Clostridia bacterium]
MMEERPFTQKLLESEPMLYRIACALLRSEADRQDAMQETALKAWKNRASLREEQYFRTWISRIMVNECHNLHRKNSRYVPMEELPDQPTPDSGEQETRLMLESLPEKQRVPLVLHYLEGFSLEEIARVQHISLALVKYRMHQARKALRVEWNGKEESK